MSPWKKIRCQSAIPEGKTLCSTQILNTLIIADRALYCGSMMCGNCCVFPESFFQGNTIQAWEVTAEMDWHPEARTNSYSMDHLTHSIKLMSLPKMRVPSGHSPLQDCSTDSPNVSSVLPSPHSQTRATRGKAGQQEHPAKGQQDGGGQSDQGCWAQQSRKWCSIHCHPQLLWVEGCCLWGECTLAGGDIPQRGCPEATSILLRACVP